MNPVIVRLFTKKSPLDEAAAAPPPSLPATLTAPTVAHTGQVGRWRLGKLLSEHDGVAVFEAWAEGSQRRQAPYVVKLARRAAPPAAREALAREAAASRAVHNAHLVSVLAAQLQESPNYVVMPRLEGRALSTLINYGEPIATATALWFARQTAQGLAALHAGGWLHGDVKPANLLIAPDGHLTLIDLGCARRLDERSDDTAPYLAGTPAYLAPEGFCSRLKCDVRSDLFSLGVVLFELLTGRLPFTSDSASGAIEARLTSVAPDVRSLNVAVPNEVAALTATLLAREPLRRPSSAAETAAALAEMEIAFLSER